MADLLPELLAALPVVECWSCDGEGNIAIRGHEPCSRCGGSGKVVQADVERLVAQIAALRLEVDRVRDEGAREVAEVKAWGQRQADEARGLREEAGALLLALSPGKLLDPRDWIEGVGSAASRLRALLVASKEGIDV